MLGRVVAVVLSLAAASVPARAASTSIVAGPGSHRATFTTVLTVASSADRPLLINADIAFHSVRALDVGSDDAAWCGPLDPTKPESAQNPRRFPLGGCPLFFAELAVPLGGTSPVDGLAATDAGRTYAFVCGVFADMRGLVAIVE